MEIKEAAEKHIPEITRLWMEFMYFNSNADPLDMNDAISLEKVTSHFTEKINSENALVVIAVEDETVVGYSVAEITRDFPLTSVGRIYDFAVTSAYRKKGIGREILAHIKEWFETREIKTIELSTVMKKYIDDSFWVKQGF